MPKISKTKEEKIKEAILNLLFEASPRSLFTAEIAKELARDEEYIKRLLQELKAKNLVVEIKKNSKGKIYRRRIRWTLSKEAFDAYNLLTNSTNF